MAPVEPRLFKGGAIGFRDRIPRGEGPQFKGARCASPATSYLRKGKGAVLKRVNESYNTERRTPEIVLLTAPTVPKKVKAPAEELRPVTVPDVEPPHPVLTEGLAKDCWARTRPRRRRAPRVFSEPHRLNSTPVVHPSKQRTFPSQPRIPRSSLFTTLKQLSAGEDYVSKAEAWKAADAKLKADAVYRPATSGVKSALNMAMRQVGKPAPPVNPVLRSSVDLGDMLTTSLDVIELACLGTSVANVEMDRVLGEQRHHKAHQGIDVRSMDPTKPYSQLTIKHARQTRIQQRCYTPKAQTKALTGLFSEMSDRPSALTGGTAKFGDAGTVGRGHSSGTLGELRPMTSTSAMRNVAQNTAPVTVEIMPMSPTSP